MYYCSFCDAVNDEKGYKLAFTIDITKNRVITELSFLSEDGVYAEKPTFSDKRLCALAEDFRGNLPAVGLIKLKNVYLFGNGCILTESRERIQSPFLPYTYLESEDGIKQSSAAIRNLSPTQWRTRPLRITEVKETAALLTQPGDRIFGHWLVDLIPMFSLIKKQYPNALPIVKSSVLSGEAIPDILEVFEIIGLDKDKALGLTENLDAYFCRELIVPSSVRYGQQLHPIVNDIYSTMRNSAVSEKPSKKLYLSRRRWEKSGSHRVLLNAEEVEAHYESLGFEIIYPELLTFREKIKLFQNANEVVGEKGTALHLSLFTNSIKKMTILLNPYERMTGLPLLQGEMCKLQNCDVDYIMGEEVSFESGYTVVV